MATLKQIEANQANAKKSTGPKTEAGKEKASHNAIRHGLTSTRTLIGAEDALEYHQLRGAFFKDYAPINIQEEFLVDRIASAAWRTLRARQMEQSLANMSIEKFQGMRQRKHNRPPTRSPKTDTEALVLSMVEDDLWRLMHRYDTQISRDFFRSTATLEKMQNDRRGRERHDRQDAHQTTKLALLQQREDRQAQQTKPQPKENWLPFEKALPAYAQAAASVNEARSAVSPKPDRAVPSLT